MRVLYLSQTGMTEPLGQSQVLPYVERLAQRGVEIDLFALEPAGRADPRPVAERLRAIGVGYHFMRRRSSSSFLVKSVESTRALARLARLARRRRPQVLHARSYLAAGLADLLRMAHPAARVLFDLRGFLPEEYVEVGHWRAGGARYRLAKQLERRLLARADLVAVLTRTGARELAARPELRGRADAIEVVPCAVDSERFRPDAAARAAMRATLDLGDRTIMVYAGNNAGYEPGIMARFARHAARVLPRLGVLVVTQRDPEPIERAFAAESFGRDDLRIRAAGYADVASYVRSADFGVAFIRPSPARLGASPTKMAEYLACGIPAVVNAGVGDNDELGRAEPGIVLAGGLDDDALAAGARELARRLTAGDQLATQCRRAALGRFDVELGVDCYERMYGRLTGDVHEERAVRSACGGGA